MTKHEIFDEVDEYPGTSTENEKKNLASKGIRCPWYTLLKTKFSSVSKLFLENCDIRNISHNSNIKNYQIELVTWVFAVIIKWKALGISVFQKKVFLRHFFMTMVNIREFY